MSCTVSDSKGNLRVHQNTLWRDATCVENRYFVVIHVDSFSPLWIVDVIDPNRRCRPYGNRSTMGVRVLGSNFNLYVPKQRPTNSEGGSVFVLFWCKCSTIKVLVSTYVFRDLQCRNGLHADHHVAPQGPGRATLEVGLVHRHVFALLGALEWNPRIHQSAIVREATADQKGHRLLWPVLHHVGDFLFELPVAVNGISVMRNNNNNKKRTKK